MVKFYFSLCYFADWFSVGLKLALCGDCCFPGVYIGVYGL